MMSIVYYIDNIDPIYRDLLKISVKSLFKTHKPETLDIRLVCTKEVADLTLGLGLRQLVIDIDRTKYYTYNKHSGYWLVNLPQALYIDTDTVFQGDISPVFELEWEIAVCERNISLGKKYPYNSGVHFCRNRQFFADMVEAECHTSAMRVEEKFCQLVDSGKYKEAIFSSDYNFTPAGIGTRVDHAKIVHYKGNRKRWMIERAMRESE